MNFLWNQMLLRSAFGTIVDLQVCVTITTVGSGITVRVHCCLNSLGPPSSRTAFLSSPLPSCISYAFPFAFHSNGLLVYTGEPWQFSVKCIFSLPGIVYK
jgi:hypothetical protein